VKGVRGEKRLGAEMTTLGLIKVRKYRQRNKDPPAVIQWDPMDCDFGPDCGVEAVAPILV